MGRYVDINAVFFVIILEDFLKSREGLVGGLESNSDSQVSKEVVPEKNKSRCSLVSTCSKSDLIKKQVIFIPFSNRNLQGPLSGRIVTWSSGFLPTRKKSDVWRLGSRQAVSP